ncbi:MAG TPA: class I SAM-dependent methyltransferase [Thermoanaerobaculia bacterium]
MAAPVAAPDIGCRHPEWREVYPGLVAACVSCGLAATTAAIEAHYDEAYFTGDTAAGLDFDSGFARAFDEARFVAELERLESRGLKGSLLDVGCATGAFLAHARARGWAPRGVEISPYARAAAQRRLGAAVAATVAEIPAAERFDVVTLHHVLEHVREPVAFLADEIRPRVGRRLLVEVPNFDSLASRRHGTRWRDLRPDQHVFHYTPSTLPRLLSRAGFRVVSVGTLWEPLWSLRTALNTLGLLPALVLPRRAGPPAGGPAAVDDPAGYRPPAGFRRLLARASRRALSPIVARLEARGLGERLVVEAEP